MPKKDLRVILYKGNLKNKELRAKETIIEIIK